MPAPTWDGKTLLFQSGQGTLAITPLSDDVIRVRFTTPTDFGRDHSYAVVNHDLGTPAVKAEIKPDFTTLTTALTQSDRAILAVADFLRQPRR